MTDEQINKINNTICFVLNVDKEEFERYGVATKSWDRTFSRRFYSRFMIAHLRLDFGATYDNIKIIAEILGKDFGFDLPQNVWSGWNHVFQIHDTIRFFTMNYFKGLGTNSFYDST